MPWFVQSDPFLENLAQVSGPSVRYTCTETCCVGITACWPQAKNTKKLIGTTRHVIAQAVATEDEEVRPKFVAPAYGHAIIATKVLTVCLFAGPDPVSRA